METIETLKIKYAHIKNIDFNNFKIISGTRYFATTCSSCDAFRGYQKPRHAERLCRNCLKTEQARRHILIENLSFIDLNDFILKNKQRLYKSRCSECSSNRGYIEPKCFNDVCLSCSSTKHNFDHKNVNFNDFIEEIGKPIKYRMNCFECGGDKGYKPVAYHNRRCSACSNKYLSKIKTKITPEHKKIRHAFSVCLYVRLKNRGSSKFGNSTFDILGYSFDDLIKHLESQFKPWMNWENHGTYELGELRWQIDHIVPDSSFAYQDVNDQGFKDSWKLSNLRPLEARQNLVKGDRVNVN